MGNSPWLEHLTFLYGAERAAGLVQRLETLVTAYGDGIPAKLRAANMARLTERDAVLITYPDQVRAAGEVPLQTLCAFLRARAAGTVSAVHLLPFYPASSDDGFAIEDYMSVAPEFGTWRDVEAIGQDFDLMVDAVFNHMSAQGAWFQQFLADEPAFRDFFVTIDGEPDLTGVVRPRALPLVKEFESASGTRKVWTTFSPDQVDLNLANPEVLLALVEVLLFYVTCSARFIRLDAIAYLWKRIGTRCIHLEETHRVIQLMRAILDRAAPGVRLITETNVPHAENISYFGDGGNEAQMVYNFALPPLTLHAFRTGDARVLARWAGSLRAPSPLSTFFNFLASHDGIGLNPARGLLSASEIDALVAGTLRRGGLISYKQNTDGSRSPYEMNINYLDALSAPDGVESDEVITRRFVTAHAVLLALPGVPGLYFHSLFGSRGDRAGADRSEMPRRINREKLDGPTLEETLRNPESLPHRVFEGLTQLLCVRRRLSAFDPSAPATVADPDPRLFVLHRGGHGEGPGVVCIQNVSGDPVAFEPPAAAWRIEFANGASRLAAGLRLEPYGCAWIRFRGGRPSSRGDRQANGPGPASRRSVRRRSVVRG